MSRLIKRFRRVFFAVLAVLTVGVCHAAPPSQPQQAKLGQKDAGKNTGKSEERDRSKDKEQQANLRKFSAWDELCRAGTFDIRAVKGRDSGSPPELGVAYACLALASSAAAPAKASGNPGLDEDVRSLTGSVLAIHGVLSGGGYTEKACRLMAGTPEGQAPSSASKQQCQLFFSALRENKGGGLLCDQAKAKGLAGAGFDCSLAANVVDGNSKRCGGPDALRCQELAGLVAALRSKDPGGCSSSVFCKVLKSRDARDCEPYLKKADVGFCARNAEELGKLKQAARGDADREKKDKDELAAKIRDQQAQIQAEAKKAQEDLAAKTRDQKLMPADAAAKLARSEQQAEAMAKKAAAKKAADEKFHKDKFNKMQPMQAVSTDIQKRMKEIEGKK